MTRSELISKLTSLYPFMHASDASRIISIMLEEISCTLARDGRVELRGFGAFSVRERKPRMGRNPRTGKIVSIDSRKVPFFKAGKQLKEWVNNKQ